jgi:hypothetical protein
MAMMRETKLYRRLPMATFISLGAFCALAAPAAAQDLMSSAPMKGVLSTLGIIAPDKDPIEYHERAPLVVPKTMDLPQPIAGKAADRNADWPVDPEVAKKAKDKAESLEPVTDANSKQPDKPKLDIATMLGLRSSTAPIEPAGPARAQGGMDNPYIPNGVLRAQGQQFAAGNPDREDDIRPGYEPKRRYLTDPPAGYRRPSDKASFKKQYGPPVKKNATEDGNGMEFRREQALRQQGNVDPDNQ